MSTATAHTIVPTGTWNIDPSHSTIGFSVKHMVIATVRGRFEQFAGSVQADDDGSIAIDGTIQTASVNTNEPQRDEHLRSADFFDAGNSPEIVFASTGTTGRGPEFAITGDITIRGVTRPIELAAEVLGEGTDPWGNPRVALEAKGELNRKDFGLNWNQVLETGGLLVSEKVKISLDLSLVRAA
ncbi:MAG: YceI family protein [Actinobacteria bacterium]|nr:YceI family protein [Actinomycetota bacterium]